MGKPQSIVATLLCTLFPCLVRAELRMIDNAGFHFVTSTPAQGLDINARKAIRSHATRAGVSRRQAVQVRSWISPSRELGSAKRAVCEEAPIQESTLSVPNLRRVGGEISGLELPPGVEPCMIQELVKLIELDKHGIYSYEICVDVNPVERGWFPYMISDECCLHSMMFSVQAFAQGAQPTELSHLARLHYAKTLQLLQARLNETDQTFATSDSTIMVVFVLASVAELMEDFATVANHIKGLEKIVNLRGGVRALNTHNNIQVKVCRADLSYALLTGHRPRLFKHGITWDCFIADRGLIKCSHQPHEDNARHFLETTLDTRLGNVLRDLHTFSCLSNLAYQTTRKIPPEMYNEIMISVLYRLTQLSFENDPIQDAIRIGLLAISSTIFMQRHFMDHPYDHLLKLYHSALFILHQSTNIDCHVPIIFWLVMLSYAVARTDHPPEDWMNAWLDKTIFRAGIDTWPQAHEMLRSIVWVDFTHDRLGKQAFEASIFRLEKNTGDT